MIKGMEEFTAELLKSKDACWKFLISAGIKTEEDRRKNEERQIYKGSNFTDRLHIELCVINKDMIKGYFLPRPIHTFNPHLKIAA